jgi:hypothetical protein
VDDYRPLPIDLQGEAASELIREKLAGPEPCMITRIGHTEMKAVLIYLNQRCRNMVLNAWSYLMGKNGQFWWDGQIRWEMLHSSGFFPCTDEYLAAFADRFHRDLRESDVLGSWLPGESRLASQFPDAKIVRLKDLEPYFHRNPWTAALEGLCVLVIHPFETSIRRQYEKRAVLFADPRVLPDFTLKTLKAVQSLGGIHSGFETWFEALKWMCERVQEIEFDVAIIGAGAYGLPIAAHVKRIGRKAVHLGGGTQILFGIRGKRWDGLQVYQRLYNEYWTRPLIEETPVCHLTTENSKRYYDDGKAYW